MKHVHKYAPLNERAIFCERCGDIRVEPQPVVYQPCPYPHWWVQPYHPPLYPWIVTSGTTTSGDITIGSTVYLTGDDNATYTLSSGSMA